MLPLQDSILLPDLSILRVLDLRVHQFSALWAITWVAWVDPAQEMPAARHSEHLEVYPFGMVQCEFTHLGIPSGNGRGCRVGN
jgi:hypothetical protein